MRTNGRLALVLAVLGTLLLLASCTRATPGAVQTGTPGTTVTAPLTGVTPPGPTAQPTTAQPPSATPLTQPPTVVASATHPPTIAPSVTPPASPSVPTSAVPDLYEDRRDPVSVLASYANAINRQEFARAWGYWENPPNPSFADFQQGFADTASLFLAVSPPQWIEGAAGNFYASIPTLLVATHTDGSTHSFVGCYQVHAINPGMLATPTAVEEWSLWGATVQAAPGNSHDAMLLAGACGPQPDVPDEDRRNPIALLASYFNAVNRQEYARAWDYWENPPNPSFADFAQGYADTASVLLVVAPPAWIGAAAGSMYSALPTLLVATHTDNSRHVYLSCYTTRAVNPAMLATPTAVETWSLWDAAAQVVPGNNSDVTLLAGACP